MPNHLSPDYFEACITASIAKESRKAEGSEELEKSLKLYSKAQICRDEAYKKPGYAMALIAAGKDYGAYIELHEEVYSEINKEFNHEVTHSEIDREKKEEYADLGLPEIDIHSLENKGTTPESVILGKFQFIIDLDAAKEEISKHTTNLLAV
jgi:hypothetical protein